MGVVPQRGRNPDLVRQIPYPGIREFRREMQGMNQREQRIILRCAVIIAALLTSALVAWGSAAAGEERVFRDSLGRPVEKLEKRSDGSWVRRDAIGRPVGMARPSTGGGYVLREPDGTPIGTAHVTSRGVIVRDLFGRPIARAEERSDGNYVVRDPFGRWHDRHKVGAPCTYGFGQ